MFDVSSRTYSAWRQTGVFAATVSTIAIWMLYLFLGFDAIDGFVYDSLLTLKSRIMYQRSAIVLVEPNSARRPDTDRLLTVAQKLLAMNARMVAFVGRPIAGSENANIQLSELKASGKILFATEAIFDPNTASFSLVEDNSNDHGMSEPTVDVSSATPLLVDGPLAVVAAVPPIHGGVYRHQRRTYSTDGRNLRSLEQAIIEQCHTRETRSDEFLVHFSGTSGSLPNVVLSDVLRGTAIADLFRNRIVLVGVSSASAVPSLTTPGCGEAKLSRLEFHGHAANTLLTRSEIKLANPVVGLTVMGLAAAMTLGLCQSIRLVVAARIVLLFVAFSLVISFGVLCWQNYWLPVVPIVLVQLASVAAVYDQRIEFLSSGVQRLAMDLDSRVKSNPAPDARSTDNPWREIVMYLRQSLDIHRIVIFDLADQSHRLQEVELFNCTFDDIQERRRDWRRAPFSWATAAKRCVNLTSRRFNFLRTAEVDEEQFLVPLIIGNRIIGFMLLGVEKSYIHSFPDFAKVLQEYSDQIIDRLYHHHRIRARTTWIAGWNLLGAIPEQNAYARLSDSTTQLERRMVRLDELFEKSDVATAVFDVSGRLLTANARMCAIVQHQATSIREMQLIELLVQFTESPEEECRRRIRSVIQSKQPTSVLVQPPGEVGQFMLCLRPMVDELGEAYSNAGEWSSFHVHGIQCELIDQTPFAEMRQRHDELADEFSNSICNHLAAVEFATDILVESYQDTDSRLHLQQLIHEQVSQAATDIRAAQSSLKKIAAGSSGLYAVDPEHPLEKAIEAVRQSSQGLTVKWNREHFRSHVLADFELLQATFESAIRTIAVNVASPCVLVIDAEEEIERIVFSIIQEGSQGEFFQVNPANDAHRSLHAKNVAIVVGSEACHNQISKLGGTIVELTDSPLWRIRFAIPRFC